MRGERHRLPAVGLVDALVLPPEGDGIGVGGDQSAVGDGDAMGVAREIAQDLLRPCERLLGVDHPFSPAQRCQEAFERSFVGERSMVAEEPDAVLRVRYGRRTPPPGYELTCTAHHTPAPRDEALRRASADWQYQPSATARAGLESALPNI